MIFFSNDPDVRGSWHSLRVSKSCEEKKYEYGHTYINRPHLVGPDVIEVWNWLRYTTEVVTASPLLSVLRITKVAGDVR